jgi:hypothetical protein
MKRLRQFMFILLIVASCIAVGTHSTIAQRARTSSATSALDPTIEPTAPYPDLEEVSFDGSDRSHTELTQRLVDEYQSTSNSDERRKLSEELERVITEHFEIRQKLRAQELEKLQAQVRRLQELHERREQEKSQIIADRLRQVLRDAEGLGWGSSDTVGTSHRRARPSTHGSLLLPATPMNLPLPR